MQTENADPSFEGTTQIVEWYLLRECPTPEMIMGFGNSFVVSATGDATWAFSYSSGFTPFADHLSFWNLGGLLFTDDISGTGRTTGSFLTGGAAMPPDGGMPVITSEMFWFSLEFTWGDLPDGSPGGQICFDSTFHF
jgi:hypothetical protein